MGGQETPAIGHFACADFRKKSDSAPGPSKLPTPQGFQTLGMADPVTAPMELSSQDELGAGSQDRGPHVLQPERLP